MTYYDVIGRAGDLALGFLLAGIAVALLGGIGWLLWRIWREEGEESRGN